MTQPTKNNDLDYTTSLLIHKNSKDVFNAINNVRGWWIGEITGNTDEIGSEFTYRYKDFHNTTQKIIELNPNKKIVWLVTSSQINFVKNKNEWLNTKIIFDLVEEVDSTRINFRHSGLTPSIQCYGGCSSGWDFYIKKSLNSFISEGKGIDPNF